MTPSDPIGFFRKKFASIDRLAEEISFSNGRMEEVLYGLRDPLPEEYLLNHAALCWEYFPDVSRPTIEAFSLQLADGKVYTEDKYMLMLNTARRDCFFYPEMNCFEPWLDYCLNVLLDTRLRTAKFYDTSGNRKMPFALPDFMEIESSYGIGVGANPDINGVYIRADDYREVVNYFKLPAPLPESLAEEILSKSPGNLFGLSYNNKTNEVLKLVYYHFPKQERERRDIDWSKKDSP